MAFVAGAVASAVACGAVVKGCCTGKEVVLILAGGTQGDTEPLLAVADELEQKGHSVVFCGEGGDLPLRSVLPLHHPSWQNELHEPLTSFQAAMDFKDSLIAKDAAALLRLTRTHHVRCVVSSAPSLPFLIPLSVLLDVPAVLLLFQYMSPSTVVPPCFCDPDALTEPPERWGEVAERALRSFHEGTQRSMATAAKVLGGKVPFFFSDFHSLVTCGTWGRVASVYGFSRILLHGAKGIFSGDIRRAREPKPSHDLASFVQQHPRPLYIGFGSMVVSKPALLTALLAARKAKVAVVLHAGWARMQLEWLSPSHPQEHELLLWARDNTLVVPSAPHGWLFPQCSAVVHHGGAGTTYAAVRAGTPSVVLPIAFDQAWHATRVVDMGLGVRGQAIDKIAPADLAALITEATTSTAIVNRCREASTVLRQENGAAWAASTIVSWHGLPGHTLQ